MKKSKKGYLSNSPDVNNPSNIIEGGDIQERMTAINEAYSLKAQEIEAYGRQMSKSPRCR